MFGNLTINQEEAAKISKIIKKYPYNIECIILMISDGPH